MGHPFPSLSPLGPPRARYASAEPPSDPRPTVVAGVVALRLIEKLARSLSLSRANNLSSTPLTGILERSIFLARVRACQNCAARPRSRISEPIVTAHFVAGGVPLWRRRRARYRLVSFATVDPARSARPSIRPSVRPFAANPGRGMHFSLEPISWPDRGTTRVARRTSHLHLDRVPSLSP